MDIHSGGVIIPKERRKKDGNIKGVMDNDGFFRTPNGSFWDCDGEYFNRHGYDIHGGSYMNVLDYVPGPTWLLEYGCYPEEKDLYLQEDKDIDEFDDNNEDGIDEEDGGFNDGNEFTEEDYKKLGISKEDLEKVLNKNNTDSKIVKQKKKKNEEEEWEECDDE